MSHGSLPKYNDFICVTTNCTRYSRVGKMLKGTFHFPELTSGVPQHCITHTKLSGKCHMFSFTGICALQQLWGLLPVDISASKPKVKSQKLTLVTFNDALISGTDASLIKD